MSVRDGLPCTLDGRGFLLDVEQFEFASMDPTRQGTDTGAGASEASLSNQVVWRRVRDNWVGGAGQDYADLPGDEDPSLEIQFAESTNLEAFERRELTLHPPLIADLAPPAFINTGAAFKLAGDTLLASKFFWGDATSPYSVILVAASAAWTSVTAAPGVILASGDTATEARWRLRLLYVATEPYLFFDFNSTGTGTTYDITLQSNTLAAASIADQDVLIAGIQVFESGVNLVVDFFLQNYTDFATNGTHPSNLCGGGGTGTVSGGQKSAAGAFPTWSSALEVVVGKGYNVGGAGFVGTDCRPWNVSISADNELHSTATSLPATLFDDYMINAAFFDGLCWRDSTTVFDHTMQQVSADYIGNQSACTITLVLGEVDPSSDGSIALTSVVPYNNQFSSFGVYVVGNYGVMRRGLTGAPSTGEVYPQNLPIWWLPNFNTTWEVAGFATPYDDGFLVLVYVGGGFGQYDIWLHNGESNIPAFSSYLAGDFTGVWAAGSRILCADDNILYELTAVPGTTTIYTHPFTLFDWKGAVGTAGGIYAWGTNGVETEIYRLPINDATGAINPPIPAGSLPVGERVTSIVEHEGVLLITSYLGFRIALIDSDGSLIFGGLLELGNCWWATALGRFAWIATSDTAGLPTVHKVDLSRFTDPDALLPAWEQLPSWPEEFSSQTAWSIWAYNPDHAAVMATSQSVSAPFFASPNQVYRFESDYTGRAVASGTYDSGWFTFGIGETLALDSVTIEADPTPNGSTHSIQVDVDTPLANSVLTGTYNPSGEGLLTVRNTGTDIRAQRFKVRLTLTGDTTTGTVPVVRRVTLRAVPAPEIASEEMLLPLVLTDTVTSEVDENVELDVYAEFQHLLSLRESRQPVTLTIGDWSKTVRVEGLAIRGGGLGGGNGLDGFDERERWLAGTWNVRVVTLD